MQYTNSNKTLTFGPDQFDRDEMIDSLEEFAEIYKNRPIDDNTGGMKAPQAFQAWFVAKKLNPKYIIESGVWYGQGTWFFEQACPEANIICLEPNMQKIVYKSNKATYFISDFNTIDWEFLKDDAENVLCFFDDHQNALQRLPYLRVGGFKHIIFEDNYPVGQGDCVSLKTSLEEKGQAGSVVESFLQSYQELPPVVKLEKTRWGDNWSNYPTEDPLITEKREGLDCFFDGADNYTWICYGRMK